MKTQIPYCWFYPPILAGKSHQVPLIAEHQKCAIDPLEYSYIYNSYHSDCYIPTKIALKIINLRISLLHRHLSSDTSLSPRAAARCATVRPSPSLLAKRCGGKAQSFTLASWSWRKDGVVIFLLLYMDYGLCIVVYVCDWIWNLTNNQVNVIDRLFKPTILGM